MISAFFNLFFVLTGVALIAVIKLYSFVLWRVVPIVGVIYLSIAVVQAEENLFTQYAPHLLVVLTVEDMEEQAIYDTRALCIARGRLLSPEYRDGYIGFVCEVQLPEKPEPAPPKISAVCHEEVRYCA